MQIKLFYQEVREKTADFEHRVNAFMATVDVVDVKLSEATYGNHEDVNTSQTLQVLYK